MVDKGSILIGEKSFFGERSFHGVDCAKNQKEMSKNSKKKEGNKNGKSKNSSSNPEIMYEL